MAYDDPLKVKSGHSHNIRTSVLIRSYFIFTPSKFDIFVTIYDHSMIFFFIFVYVDLWWPHEGQTRSQPDGFHIKFDL